MTEHHSRLARMLGFCDPQVPRLCLRTGKKMPGSITASTRSSRPHWVSRPALACPATKMSRERFTPTAREVIFQIRRGVTYNFHDHLCCSLKRSETQWLVCHPPFPPPTPPGRIASSMAQLPLIIWLRSIFTTQELLPRPRAATFATT